MFTVSVHGIQLHAKVGLYPEEKIKGNDFEIDVDVLLNINKVANIPFLDYTELQKAVTEAFKEEGELLEDFLKKIHQRIKKQWPEIEKLKITIRKMNPPIEGKVKYTQVCFEG